MDKLDGSICPECVESGKHRFVKHAVCVSVQFPRSDFRSGQLRPSIVRRHPLPPMTLFTEHDKRKIIEIINRGFSGRNHRNYTDLPCKTNIKSTNTSLLALCDDGPQCVYRRRLLTSPCVDRAKIKYRPEIRFWPGLFR